MKAKPSYSHHASMNADPFAYSEPDSEQHDRDRVNRRKTLRSVLRYARQNGIGADGLIELVCVLGLDEELDEMAALSPVRQQIVAATRAKLETGIIIIPESVSDGS